PASLRTPVAVVPLPALPPNLIGPRMPWSPHAPGWGTPDNIYALGAFQLGFDDALVIEGRSPRCTYWGVQLWNRYMQSLDYRHHRVSINGAQAVLEPDGSFRVVVAHRDPGLPNRLDPAGHTEGVVFCRWLRAEEMPEPPTSRVVPLEALGDVRRAGGCARARIDPVARHAAQQGDEARQRRDDLQRIPMGLDDAGVRVHGEERIERPEMSRRLEHPARPRTAPLEILELAAVRGVYPAQIRRLQPVVVARHAVRRREKHAREVVRGERDALLRQLGAHRVHRLEARDEPVDAREVLLHLRDARVGAVRRPLGRWPRIHHLPGHRHPVGGIL